MMAAEFGDSSGEDIREDRPKNLKNLEILVLFRILKKTEYE